MGLAVVYTNIQQSGGFIDVETGVNKGTAFNIYLPCVEEQGPEDLSEQLQRRPHPGWETILLVEDDEIVRTLTSQVLELEGYSVLTASSGSEAIDRFYKSQKPIELLVTDVVMPDMNGLDLARELQQTTPDLKVLYVSGYLNDHVLPQMKLGRQSFFWLNRFYLKNLWARSAKSWMPRANERYTALPSARPPIIALRAPKAGCSTFTFALYYPRPSLTGFSTLPPNNHTAARTRVSYRRNPVSNA